MNYVFLGDQKTGILRTVLEKSKILLITSALLSVVSAGVYVLLISKVNNALSNDFDLINAKDILVFFVLAGLAALISIFSQRNLSMMGLGVARDLREILAAKIADSDARTIEEVGRHRLFASITQDIARVADGVSYMPSVMVSSFSCIAGIIYMGSMSMKLLGMILVPLLLGGAIIRLSSKRMRICYRQLREQLDILFKHYDGLTAGYKELQIHTPTENYFHKNILSGAVSSVYALGCKAQFRWALMTGVQSFLFFAAIGCLMCFSLFGEGYDRSVLTGYLLVILYLREPITILVYSIPSVSQASVALQKIGSLGLSDSVGEHPYKEFAPPPSVLNSIELCGVEFDYAGALSEHSLERSYKIGPIDLNLSSGEIVFIVGGNGSGKSTLGKVLCGLYSPTSGSLQLNGDLVTDSNRIDLRNHFSAVFSDYYLFDHVTKNCGELAEESDVLVLLRELDLEGKVVFSGGEFSTVTKLSQGQKKRLAMLVAYVSDRPIYLFDEWSSDQDPEFKKYFYERMLINLKAAGKCIVVISHDDDFFGVADRVVKMVDGNIKSVTSVSDTL